MRFMIYKIELFSVVYLIDLCTAEASTLGIYLELEVIRYGVRALYSCFCGTRIILY